jgi:DNA-binding transcriptional MerR regulator
MSRRLTIGDFSRATHLSVKTLRHYHSVELLEPATIDPHTGYRYYDEGQIPLAQVVRRLRDLEMPIPEVKAVLAAPQIAARNALITAHLNSLEAELARTRQAVGALRDLLQPAQTPLSVEYRTVPAVSAAAITQIVNRADMLAWWHGALGELRATATAQRLTALGPVGGLYDGDIFRLDRGRATVFLPTDGVVRPVGRVESQVVAPAELALVSHHGSLANIDVTYGALGAHTASHEISVEGPLREYYLCGFQDTDDSTRWQTEIGWPIFRADDAG